MGVKDSSARFSVIGKVLKPHGIRGELKVLPLTSRPVQIFSREQFYVRAGQRGGWYRAKECRWQGNYCPLKLEGVETRNDAELLRNGSVEIHAEDRPPLESGTYYISDLIGLLVKTSSGDLIGQLVEILQNSAQDIYVVKRDDEEIMIPAVASFIKHIDTERGEVIIEPIEGLLD